MIAIRTKGNHKQGMGDITGSLAVADELLKKKMPCLLIIDNDIEAIEALETSGHKFITVSSWPEEMDWWRGPGSKIQCVLFNQLNSDIEKVRFLKENVKCIIATFDDIGPSAEIADIRFNPLYYYRDSKTGPEYIPLKKVFQDTHELSKAYKPEVEKFLITLGGSDTWGFTPEMIKILSPLSAKLGQTTIIIGSAYKHQKELDEELKKWNGKVEILKRIPSEEMAKRMFESDLALCSGGLTVFEMACCGTPAAVLSNEPWELETAGAMEKLGYGRSLGFGKNINEDFVLKTVKEFASDKDLREKHGIRGKKLVDGKGAERVATDIITKFGR